MIEENFWRAIRYGLDGRLIDLERREEYPAVAARDRLLAWTTPARMALGIDVALPEENGGPAAEADAGRGRDDRGRLRRGGGAHPEPLRGRGGRDVSTEPTEERLLEALRRDKETEDVIVQTVATLVNLAGQKLSVEGAKDPEEAKNTIDAARHMLPLVRERRRPPVPETRSTIQMLYVKES